MKTVYKERSLFFIPPGIQSELNFASFNKMYQLVFHEHFLEHPDFIDCNDPAAWGRGNRIRCYRPAPETAGGIQTVLSQIDREYRENRANFQAMLRLKIKELFLILQRSQPHIVSADLAEGSLGIGEIRAYIKTHYADESSLPILAGLCGLTPGYLSRTFREKTGTPLFEFINRIRVQKACTLLKRSDMSIIDIAFSVGYNNVSFFNRYFRKILNMSPREYRNFSKM